MGQEERIEELKLALFANVKDTLEKMSDYEYVSLYNDFCDKANYTDDRVFSISELDELLAGKTPSEIMNISKYIDLDDKYIWFNGYGNLRSGSNPADFPVYIDDIVNYIVDNDWSFGNSEISSEIEEYIEKVSEIEEEEEQTL